MEGNNFKESLKVSGTDLQTHSSQLESASTEALYHYSYNSLEEILDFLRDYYEKNPMKNMPEENSNQPSSAQSYYYSLKYELSNKYTNFFYGKVSIEEFKKQFNDILSHYETDPLKVYDTHNKMVTVRENSIHNDLENLVGEMEAHANSYWEKNRGEQESEPSV